MYTVLLRESVRMVKSAMLSFKLNVWLFRVHKNIENLI